VLKYLFQNIETYYLEGFIKLKFYSNKCKNSRMNRNIFISIIAL